MTYLEKQQHELQQSLQGAAWPLAASKASELRLAPTAIAWAALRSHLLGPEGHSPPQTAPTIAQRFRGYDDVMSKAD